MNFLNSLKTVERSEVLPLSLLFIHSFLNGFALVFFETTANTLFLTTYNTSQLPYVYILTAIVSVVLGYFYTKIEDNFDIKKVLKITMLFILCIVGLFFISLQFSNDKAIIMSIMVFKDSAWVFVGLEFGILTSMIFNIRQGKRLFGLIMSGEILAGIIGGFLVGYIITFINIEYLLLISFVAFIISFFILIQILSKFSEKFDNEEDEYSDDESNISYSSLFKNNYYLFFFAISILSFFVFYFIDYIFYYKVEEHFTNEAELAKFFGMFFAMLSVVNLFSSLFITGKMLSRYGIAFGLFAIPVLALFGMSFLAILSSFSIAFLLLISIKLLDEVMDISILSPTFRILYQPIPMKYRTKVLAFRETIIEPLSY